MTTRNGRLAAIHSLFGYLALHHPEHAASIQRVLAIPAKRTQRNLVTYLTDDEVDALLDSCDTSRWTGAAITPCSPSPSRPDCASPSSQA